MEFTRTVDCNDELGDWDRPEVLVVEIDAALAKRIRELAAEVKRLGVSTVTLVDNHANWYSGDWDEDASVDGVYPSPGEGFSGLDCETLVVRGEDCWWEAYLKGASVKASCESILISELPE